jgi:hypothetical protein
VAVCEPLSVFHSLQCNRWNTVFSFTATGGTEESQSQYQYSRLSSSPLKKIRLRKYVFVMNNMPSGPLNNIREFAE